MTNRFYQCLVIWAVFPACGADDSGLSCGSSGCDGLSTSAYVDDQVSHISTNTFKHATAADLLQHKAEEIFSDKCRRRCHYHPKHDCRLICRISCVKGKPVKNPKCQKGTTTTTTSKEFSNKDPPSSNETCNYASTLKSTFASLTVNTLGDDVESPRMLFKDVVELSSLLKDKKEWNSRKLDLVVEDASQKPRYVNNPEKNIVSAIYEQGGLTKYVRDSRNMTGAFNGAIRIGLDDPGSYVFRFTLLDSETGEPAALPLFPFTFYDVDGEGEIVSTCDATRVISVDSKLEEKTDAGCFVHHSYAREVNLPKDFEHLTGPQIAQSVTYVYANKASWDVQLHLSPETPQRYFIMKSSNVIACSGQIQKDEADIRQWKNPGQPRAADQ